MKETFNHDWATTKISEQIIYNRLFDECNEIAEHLKAGGKWIWLVVTKLELGGSRYGRKENVY